MDVDVDVRGSYRGGMGGMGCAREEGMCGRWGEGGRGRGEGIGTGEWKRRGDGNGKGSVGK